jgi:bile acid:Na+ symporter, BASS family
MPTSPSVPRRLVALNGFVRRRFVHLVSVVSLVSFVVPEASQALRAPALGPGLDASGLSLFFMMLSAAIQCSASSLRGVFARPRPLLLCLGLYFVVLPLACYGLGQLCVPLLGRALGDPIQLGLYLVILMPVAATASIWVRDTRGDLDLLVSLVVITMATSALSAPAYLYAMSGLAKSSIAVSPLVILRQLLVGVLVPLVVGVGLNRALGPRLPRLQPWFALLGNLGLFMAVFLNVGTAAPLLRAIGWAEIGGAVLIVLLVNLVNFIVGGLLGRAAGLGHAAQVACEFSSGMRSNGTALVVGLASFPTAPLVTVPAAIYIVLQHLIAGLVRARLESRALAAAPIAVPRTLPVLGMRAPRLDTPASVDAAPPALLSEATRVLRKSRPSRG